MNGERVIEDGLITRPTASTIRTSLSSSRGPSCFNAGVPGQSQISERSHSANRAAGQPIGEKPATSNQGASTHQALSLPRLVFGEWLPLFAPSDEQFGGQIGQSYPLLQSYLGNAKRSIYWLSGHYQRRKHSCEGQETLGQNIRLALRQSDSGGYSAWFSGGRRFGIGKVVGGKYVTLIMGDSSESCDDFFDFDFSSMGDTLTLSVNGQPLLITHDSSHSAGTVSVGGLGNGLFKDVAMFIPTRESLVADNRKPPAEPMSEESPAGDQAATSHGNVDLLKLADPTKDVIIGKWSLKEDVIIGKRIAYVIATSLISMGASPLTSTLQAMGLQSDATEEPSLIADPARRVVMMKL